MCLFVASLGLRSSVCPFDDKFGQEMQHGTHQPAQQHLRAAEQARFPERRTRRAGQEDERAGPHADPERGESPRGHGGQRDGNRHFDDDARAQPFAQHADRHRDSHADQRAEEAPDGRLPRVAQFLLADDDPRDRGPDRMWQRDGPRKHEGQGRRARTAQHEGQIARPIFGHDSHRQSLRLVRASSTTSSPRPLMIAFSI